jgi:hypothetical protein
MNVDLCESRTHACLSAQLAMHTLLFFVYSDTEYDPTTRMALLSTVLNEQAASASRHIRVELVGQVQSLQLRGDNNKDGNYLTLHTFWFIRCCKYATSRRRRDKEAQFLGLEAFGSPRCLIWV